MTAVAGAQGQDTGVQRAKMLRVTAPDGAVDIVGTGGDGSGSVNVSTCASFIVAGAGITVAKHGNRALSSRSGAADVLSSLGVKIDLSPDDVGRCIREAGIGFMFAPAHHPAMKNVNPSRVELATRTIFNLLGPLSNPAGVRRQMTGVFSRQWIEPVAQVLKALGSEAAWVAHGSDGLDEITTSGPTHIAALEKGAVRTFEINPEDIGIEKAKPEMLRGVSVSSTPTRDLNHWRSASTSVINAIGTPQICDASNARSSNRCSGSVSRCHPSRHC